MKSRFCYSCGNQIEECMGFVSARDFLKLSCSSSNQKNNPRELCGKCGFLALERPDDFIEKLN